MYDQEGYSDCTSKHSYEDGVSACVALEQVLVDNLRVSFLVNLLLEVDEVIMIVLFLR